MKSKCYFDCKFPIGNLGLRRGLLLPKLTRQVWRAETTIVSLNVDVDQLKKSQEQLRMKLVSTAALTLFCFSFLENVNCQGRRKIICQYRDKLHFIHS